MVYVLTRFKADLMARVRPTRDLFRLLQYLGFRLGRSVTGDISISHVLVLLSGRTPETRKSGTRLALTLL